MAIGGDQGGSICTPACWCGIVGLKAGLKPTCGLVPYTDLCQCNVQVAPSYGTALTGEVNGLKVSVVTEGFAWSGLEPDVDELVEAAAF